MCMHRWVCFVCVCALCTHRRMYTWMNRSLYHLNLLWSTSPSYTIRMNSLNWHFSTLTHTHPQYTYETWSCTHTHARTHKHYSSPQSFLLSCISPSRCCCLLLSGCVCVLRLRATFTCDLWAMCARAFHSMIKLSFFSSSSLSHRSFFKRFIVCVYFSFLLFFVRFFVVGAVCVCPWYAFHSRNFGVRYLAGARSVLHNIRAVFPIDLNVIINGIQHSASSFAATVAYNFFVFLLHIRFGARIWWDWCATTATVAAAVVDGTLAMACAPVSASSRVYRVLVEYGIRLEPMDRKIFYI